ncbi:very short patch repair endonuclease [Usitatibacter rugosus]|uniref:very short patch repair endonuclease n=1 Tax=Usitatibacter rugosus TaxID=2732067 RepID=UPI00148911B5
MTTKLRTTAARSAQMAKVRSRGNASTELRLARILRAADVTGWRRHMQLAGRGRPDFVFRESRLAIFVDGCFWHGCPICARPLPRSNRKFWQEKISGNRARDRRQSKQLRDQGWKVLRIWEHSFRRPEAVVLRIRNQLRVP